MSITGWPVDIMTTALPCDPPTLEEFRARFPEFSDLTDAQVQFAIDDASCWADQSWISTYCRDCTTAIAFLAAHFLALGLIASTLLPETVAGEDGGVVLPGGQVTSLSFENMSVGFAAPSSTSGSAGTTFGRASVGDPFDLGSTPYGQRYLSLLKVNQPAIMVV